MTSRGGEHPENVLAGLQPGSVFAGYRIECVLDRGGMGVVYRATDPDLDRTVALKIIAPEHTTNETAVKRFKVEARLAASLEHPHIVPIHRGGEHAGVLYLAMRYVPGTNLRHIINRGPLDLRRIVRITRQVAGALDAAHGRNLVHRDVKPGNILVTGEGEHEHVYLTDFGLTKRLGSIGGDLTRTGGWVGTPDYVAPEQIQDRQVDGRADVYSLGCVLYEMLTGHVAYPKDSDVAKLWAHVSDPPPLPSAERPDLVQAFDDAIARATAKDPDDRFATAGDLAEAVAGAVAEQESADWGREADAERATEGSEDPWATRIQMTPDEVVPPAGRSTADEPVAAPAPAAAAASVPAPAVAARPDPPSPPPPPRRGADGRGDGGWFGRHRGPALGGLAFLAAAVVVAVVVLSGGGSGSGGQVAPKGDLIPAALTPLPLNRVKGNGDVDVRLDGTVATVGVTAKGLLNNAAHAMHIHAGALGSCPDSSAARRHNGKLVIAAHDGAPFYGPPVTSLTTRGDTGPNSVVAFARFPNQGTIDYRRRIRLSSVVAAQIRENNAVVVIHGIDYNRNGIYDNSLDRSDLKRSLPGESTIPALCGSLKSKTPASDGAGKKSAAVRRYHASLVRASESPAWRWLCDPSATPDSIL